VQEVLEASTAKNSQKAGIKKATKMQKRFMETLLDLKRNRIIIT
jgi:hypothetical protein